MYIIVNFESDNTIEAVPSTWLKNNLCAWPRDGKKAKKFILRKMIPNEFDFKWISARKIGERTYESYHEAKLKLNLAQGTSDLSTAEDELETRKIRKTKSPSPRPIKKYKKTNFFKPPAIYCNKVVKKVDVNSDMEERSDEDDEAKDPDYCNAPNDKSIVSKVNNSSSSSDIENMTSLTVTKARKELFPSSPLLNDDILCSSNYVKSTSNITTLNQTPSNLENASVYVSKQNVYDSENPMSSKNVENLDSSTLTCIKYDLKCQAYKIDALTSICQSIFDKLENNHDPRRSNFESFEEDMLESLYDIWPIANNESLELFEKLLEDCKKKKACVAILARVTVKDIKESVRAIMKRMFTDSLLSNYSYIGFKGKSSFSKLRSCLLVFDAIRKAPRFRESTDDLIKTPLKQWLAQAPARVAKKEITQGARYCNEQEVDHDEPI